jgi:molybdopterin converting factor small subunit
MMEEVCSMGALGATLRELVALLGEHFKEEEAADGLYDTVTKIAPRYSGRVKLLAQEHAALLASAEAAERRASETSEEISSLIAKLRRHEEMETELLNEAVLSDLGGGD